MTVYFNGSYMDRADVSISPDDRGFVFGDGVYEVARAEDGALFQLDAHRRRLARSLAAIQITGLDTDTLWTRVRGLLPRNGLDEGPAKVYLQITRGAAPRQHAFPDAPVEPTVYARASAHAPPLDKWANGVKVILRPDQRWDRCDIKSLNYLPNVLANQAAQEAGAYEALLVRDGFVTEGSHSSVAAVFDGTVTLHPFTNRTLPGITREVVLELCEDRGLPVEKFPVAVDDLPDAEELFLMGTTTGVMPIVQVDDWTVGDGTPGPVAQELLEAFRALTPV
ncbi:aminotransferase class IV [Salinibacter altiplanensis]|uniref:aminotransferase class IV n=1 Tax=Salinibacter altiplanensis TaxID=1803181 RepID=UPI000C9F6EDA|nr:aminotransferase class IV [Salinibacter altiplanensis]